MSGERLKFRAKNEHELAKLSDDDLVAYLVAARDAGPDLQVRCAAGILVFRRYRNLLNFIRVRVRSEEDAEDLVAIVIEQTIRAGFKGHHAGEFFEMMKTIRGRRLADYYEGLKRQPDVDQGQPDGPTPLDGATDDDDFVAGVNSRMVMEGVLADYSERDRMVVEMRMDGFSAKETAAEVAASGVEGGGGMTPANVDQIFSRFKKKMAKALSEERGDSGPEAAL